jgi:chromosome segregation ATPase
MEFCERHMPGLDGTTITLLPVQNEGYALWSERVAAVGDPERLTYHVSWAFMARYARHMSSML